ncbi:MAG: hypothetical protein V4621_08100 [Pseudomonadota bacterium]
MPNGFRLLGTHYVGKAGATIANGGTGTKDNPFNNHYETQTVNVSTAIVGAGVYEGDLSMMQGPQHVREFMADGQVTVKAANVNLSRHDYSTINWYDYTWQGPMVMSNANGGGSFTGLHKRCVFLNVTFNLIPGGGSERAAVFFFEDCIFINCTCLGTELPVSFNRCILINSQFNRATLVMNTYADSASTLRGDMANTENLKSCYQGASGFFDALPYGNYQALHVYINNNIRGQVASNATDPLNDVITWQAANPTHGSGNINLPPNFNKPESYDFTLKINSQHLDKGIGPEHLRYALMYYVEFTGSVGDPCTVANTRLKSSADGSYVNFIEIGGFTVNEQGGLVIATNTQNSFEAFYTTDRIRLASTPQVVTRLPVIFGANYNTDYPTVESGFSSNIPEVFNNNVPARNAYSSGTAGRNPARLTCQARFTPILSPDINTSGDWIANGAFLDYEVNRQPAYNAAGNYGTGHPLFDPTPALVTTLKARWAQFRYRARNNYFSR